MGSGEWRTSGQSLPHTSFLLLVFAHGARLPPAAGFQSSDPPDGVLNSNRAGQWSPTLQSAFFLFDSVALYILPLAVYSALPALSMHWDALQLGLTSPGLWTQQS